MHYIILIYGDEKNFAMMSESPEAKADMYAAFMRYGADMQAAGVLRGGAELKPTHSATTVRVRNGKTLTTDGPFAETKEQLGGFYLIEARDLNDAIQVASRIPSARTGSIEVRPVVDTLPLRMRTVVALATGCSASPAT